MAGGARSPPPSSGYPSQVPYDWQTRKRYLDLPFPVSEYEERIRRVRSSMGKRAVDALLVFGDQGDPGDLVYLSNYIPFGRAALILPMDGAPEIVTDAVLHGEPINSYAWMTWIEDYRPVRHDPREFARVIAESLARAGARTVGLVGGENLPMPIWVSLSSSAKVAWVDFSPEYTLVKSIRSQREVGMLRDVGSITARAMEASIEAISPGRSESEVAAVANYTMTKEGAHSGFSIANSGPRSGIKHSYPTPRRMEKGDMVYLDMGAVKYGYQSDMSRTVVIGGANREQRRVLDVIENAYETLTGMMRPGVRVSKLLKRSEELARASGLRERYRGQDLPRSDGPPCDSDLLLRDTVDGATRHQAPEEHVVCLRAHGAHTRLRYGGHRGLPRRHLRRGRVPHGPREGTLVAR